MEEQVSSEQAEQITSEHVCMHCHLPIAAEARFCNHCGALQEEEGSDIDDTIRRQKWLGILSLFFGILVVISLIAAFGKIRTLGPLLGLDTVFSITTVCYAIAFRKELRPLFKWNNFSVVKVLLYAGGAVVAALIVNVIVKWLNRSIFDGDVYYYELFSGLKYAKSVAILVVAVQPAIFEELAFRGVFQQGLQKVMDTNQAIFLAAFLFALLHMSFISFFWLLPFAIALGHICRREQTLWYGVLIHFCFNATACLFEFWELNLF